jgi:hypothetical protein
VIAFSLGVTIATPAPTRTTTTEYTHHEQGHIMSHEGTAAAAANGGVVEDPSSTLKLKVFVTPFATSGVEPSAAAIFFFKMASQTP